jgi:two-component system sensor histidine kinase BarA
MVDSIIDWELAIKLAGNSRDFAEKMLGLLAKDLSTEVTEIKKAYETKNNEELKRRVHKLHGALCYCGAVKLKNATATLENALEHQLNEKIPTLMSQFEQEAKQLLKEANCFLPS